MKGCPISTSSNGRSRPPYLTLAVFAVVAAIAVAVLWYVAPTPGNDKPTITSSGTADIGGPFTLTDNTGRRVTDKTYAGKYMLVYFGYTYCPDTCPTELSLMSRAVDQLGKDASAVQPIFITIDPERDTVKEMADYVSHFGSSLVGLTGTPEEIASVAKAYRVFYQKVAQHTEDGAKADPGGYLMNHSSFIYLMGPDGAYIDNFAPGTTPQDMAKRIRSIIDGGAK
jgi:cytochrome oxidase Cu insertion factor (SCO1/SenC/PrrC family)